MLFLSKTLYPLLSTGSSQGKTLSRPDMTEKHVDCDVKNQTEFAD